MAGTDDSHHLGLSLSLSSSPLPDPLFALNLMPPSSSSAPPPPPLHLWNDLFFSSDRKGCHEMPFLRGIDVNRVPVSAERDKYFCEEDEEAGVSSPNSTLSSLSGKRGLPARSCGEQEAERAGSDDDDGADTGGGGSRKKLRLSKDQSAVLEDSFNQHNTLNPKQKLALAKQLNLKPRQVEVWFQNRRARTKLKQTEVDCELLKRCCESLTEENRRLQKEVQELRALKLVSPHLYMRVAPPTTLTMCPSCERLSNKGASAPPKPEVAPQLHRSVPVAGVGPSGPWGPVPVRPMFVAGPAQRS